MRVKIGETWFSCELGRSIMIELEERDKQNITAMHPDAHYYALFDDAETSTKEGKLAWMKEGAKHGD